MASEPRIYGATDMVAVTALLPTLEAIAEGSDHRLTAEEAAPLARLVRLLDESWGFTVVLAPAPGRR